MDYPGGPNLITVVLVRGRMVKVRRRPCDDGTRVRERMELCQQLDFSSLGLISDFQNCKIINLYCFKLLSV